ncbi:hypothetical protein NLJ89_g1371 [Agrocybe chaxingu]|uniref:F-box domain-containing protein n=1 Tax=Agrocybe chaxingu TaxID=84603 RepID=A0A9W8N029_9AGAR|nr:hypothetical protein NLJ89_g1371 [Agrocybe chaxingu]
MCLCPVCGTHAAAERGQQCGAFPPRPSQVHHSCRDLKNLEAQISTTKTFLAHLESHLLVLRSEYNRAHDHFTHRLPPEIISRVFGFCASREGELSPFDLGAVCKRWREIAWSTPQLWTSLDVDLNWLEINSQTRSWLIQEWLSRSGELPLSISVTYVKTDMAPLPLAILENILDVLNRFSRRWRDLDLSIPFALLPALCGDGDGVSILNTLRISPPEILDDAEEELVHRLAYPFQITNASPSLQRVAITSFPFSMVGINWQNVTDVSFDDIPIYDFHSLLREARNLIKCIVDIKDDGSRFSAPPSIERPCLIDLDIGLHQTFQTSPSLIFDPISLPRLKKVTYRPGYQPFAAFAAFIERSRCSLEALILDEVHEGEGMDIILMNEDALWNLLWNLRTLTTLVFNIPVVAKKFFDLLYIPYSPTTNPDQPIFLPQITSIRHDCDEVMFSWDRVIRSATSRLKLRGEDGQPILRLLEFQVHELERLDELLVARICHTVASGVEIRIKRGLEDVLETHRREYEQARFGTIDGSWEEDLL